MTSKASVIGEGVNSSGPHESANNEMNLWAHGARLELRHSAFVISSSFVILSFIILLGGCALGPNYKRPPVAAPANYRFATSLTTNSLGDLPWWQVFQDPVLQDLIGTALTNNYDLKQAVARVEQARQQVIVARAPLFPQIGHAGGIGRGKKTLINTPAAP